MLHTEGDMKTIRFQVDEATHRRLTKMRREKGFPSIPAMLLDQCGELTPEKEAQEIARRARANATKLEIGDEFSLRDLFKRNEWDNFDRGVRVRAGKMFMAYVEQGTSGIIALGKNASNHQIYKVMSKPAG